MKAHMIEQIDSSSILERIETDTNECAKYYVCDLQTFITNVITVLILAVLLF